MLFLNKTVKMASLYASCKAEMKRWPVRLYLSSVPIVKIQMGRNISHRPSSNFSAPALWHRHATLFCTKFYFFSCACAGLGKECWEFTVVVLLKQINVHWSICAWLASMSQLDQRMLCKPPLSGCQRSECRLEKGLVCVCVRVCVTVCVGGERGAGAIRCRAAKWIYRNMWCGVKLPPSIRLVFSSGSPSVHLAGKQMALFNSKALSSLQPRMGACWQRSGGLTLVIQPQPPGGG